MCRPQSSISRTTQEASSWPSFLVPFLYTLGWPQEQCPKAAAPNSRPPPSDPKPAIVELIEYHHLPDWAKDNCFIRTGYRRVKACDRHCLDSLWYLHNETLNVWTHGLPFLLGWVDSLKTLLIDLPALGANTTDVLAFLPLVLGTLMCYFCSATFHLYLCHSPERFSLWSKLDYLGIVCVMGGGFWSMTWYMFYECLVTKSAYIAVNALCCLCVCCVILQDRFASPAFRTLRVISFALLFGTSGLPTYVAFSREASDPSAVAEILYHYKLCFLAILIGALIFALRVPERFVPKVFDCIGHSHSLFHVMVVVSIGCYHRAVLQAFVHRDKL